MYALKDKYIKEGEGKKQSEDDVIEAIENNGHPKEVLNLLMKQRDRD